MQLFSESVCVIMFSMVWNRCKAVVFVMIIFVLGCAGRDPNPVAVRQVGDETRSCGGLEREMIFIEDEIRRLLPKTDKTAKNVGLGIAGVFFLVPWFFMDLSHAEQMEVDAYRQRYNYLLGLSTDRGCNNPTRQPIPDFRDTSNLQQQNLQQQQLLEQQKQLEQLQQQLLHEQKMQQLKQEMNEIKKQTQGH